MCAWYMVVRDQLGARHGPLRPVLFGELPAASWCFRQQQCKLKLVFQFKLVFQLELQQRRLRWDLEYSADFRKRGQFGEPLRQEGDQ